MFDAKKQAEAQYLHICALIDARQCDFDRIEELEEMEELDDDDKKELSELKEQAGEWKDIDSVDGAIRENALSVEVRSDWVSNQSEMSAKEFRIVLCTGGPHVEIVGELTAYGEPRRSRILYRCWGESGELMSFDRDIVEEFCSAFCFEL